MPLLDHFRSSEHPGRRWPSFFNAWVCSISRTLNRSVLPEGFLAEVCVRIGNRLIEGTTDQPQDWNPPAPDRTMPALFPEVIEVRVLGSARGLLAVVALVGPKNKQSSEQQRAFANKCAAYLHEGIGLVIVDIVTEHLANLHDELMRLLRQDGEYGFPGSPSIYAVAYRPVRRDAEGNQLDVWTNPLAVGQPLPTMPLALCGGPTVPVELEATYTEARLDSRL